MRSCLQSRPISTGCAHTVIIHYCGRLKPWKPHYVGVLDVFYHELMEEIQK